MAAFGSAEAPPAAGPPPEDSLLSLVVPPHAASPRMRSDAVVAVSSRRWVRIMACS